MTLMENILLNFIDVQEKSMQKTIIIGMLLVVVLSACGGSAPEVQTADGTITVYKPPT